MSPKEVLEKIVEEAIYSLEELEEERDRNNLFCTGKIYALEEILEIIKNYSDDPACFGLDINIEEKYPLD